MSAKKVLLIIAIVAGLTASAEAGPIVINNVPDWNQPKLVDNNLADPGPVVAVNSPAAGNPKAWCTPTASANIMGFYRDTMAGLTIADNSVFPATTLRPAVNWRDDTLDNLTNAPTNRQDIGWYLNTDNMGNQNAPMIIGAMTGTDYRNVQPGLAKYFADHGLANVSVVNFVDTANANVWFPAGGPGIDNSGVASPHVVPMAYTRIQNRTNVSQPLLLHLASWALANRQQVRVNGPAGLANYDYATWATPNPNGPGEEVYSDTIGHTVTVVGYWDGGAGLIPGNPFSGSGNGNSTPPAVIVYDNTDGTLGGGSSLPLVLPFAVGQANPGLNVPWVFQTEFSQVPEPATMTLLAFGGLLAAGRLLRRKRTR